MRGDVLVLDVFCDVALYAVVVNAAVAIVSPRRVIIDTIPYHQHHKGTARGCDDDPHGEFPVARVFSRTVARECRRFVIIMANSSSSVVDARRHSLPRDNSLVRGVCVPPIIMTKATVKRSTGVDFLHRVGCSSLFSNEKNESVMAYARLLT